MNRIISKPPTGVSPQAPRGGPSPPVLLPGSYPLPPKATPPPQQGKYCRPIRFLSVDPSLCWPLYENTGAHNSPPVKNAQLDFNEQLKQDLMLLEGEIKTTQEALTTTR